MTTDLGYEIIIKNGILSEVFNYLDTQRQYLIVKDDGIPNIYLDTLLKQKKCFVLTLEQGEKNKSFENYLKIQDFLLKHEFKRSDALIALGGGVIGDIVGFAASTFKRGISYIQIPTSTMAQIDSSIGGKTAINFQNFKNIIGTFYQPEKVFIDPSLLKTLSKKNFNNGLIEGLKMALLFDEKLFNIFLNDNINKNINTIITRSVELKKEIIIKDFKEKNIRKVLNFGHTIGHALESYYHNEKCLHGECVGQGMLYFIKDKDVKEKVKFILKKLDIQIKLDYKIDEILNFIKNDKKKDNDFFDVIVLNKIANYSINKLSINEIKEILERGI